MDLHVLPPTVLELYNRVHRLAGVIETLTDHGEQLLALSEEYPDCEALHRLLATMRTELIEARRQRQDTLAAIARLSPDHTQS